MRPHALFHLALAVIASGCGSDVTTSPDVDAGNTESTEQSAACDVTPVSECASAECMVITGSPIVDCEVESAQPAGCAERGLPVNALITCAVDPESGICYRFPSSLVPATFTAATCERGACLSGEACERGPYDACDGKACGDDCDPCDPFDPACPNRGATLTCNAGGECVDPATVECSMPKDAAVSDETVPVDAAAADTGPLNDAAVLDDAAVLNDAAVPNDAGVLDDAATSEHAAATATAMSNDAAMSDDAAMSEDTETTHAVLPIDAAMSDGAAL